MFKTAMPFEGQAVAIFVTSIVMASFSVIAVALRCFVRLGLVRGAFGRDDALMLLGLLLFIGLNICCSFGAIDGVGHHLIEFTNLNTYKKALWEWWLGQQLYLWSSAIVKVSIAVALLRLAVKRWHRVVLWMIVGTVIVVGLFFWLILLFDCKPVQHFWQRVDPTYQGTCLSTEVLLYVAYTYSAITILCDFTLGGLPIIMVWSLQMDQHTKIAVGTILGLGAIASVAVVIRIPFLHYYSDPDFLYSTTQIVIWSVIETGLGIIAGSLITLRPLIRWLVDGRVNKSRYGTAESAKGKLSNQSSSMPLNSLESGAIKSSQSKPDHVWACPNCQYPLAAKVPTKSVSFWRPKTPNSTIHASQPSQSLSLTQDLPKSSSLEQLNPTVYDPDSYNKTTPLSPGASSRISSIFKGTNYR